MITQELMLKHFEYKNGSLFWSLPTNQRIKSGQRFGYPHYLGYRLGQLFGKKYFEHRLIWLYHYGNWPTHVLDHTNGDKNDNRIENLREATTQQNQFNRKSVKNSSSKYKGVCWHVRNKKWMASYRHLKKSKFLGYYDTEEAAAQAYRDATEAIHMEYGRYE